MPYITQEKRDAVIDGTGAIDISYSLKELGLSAASAVEDGGDIQYVVAEIAHGFIQKKGINYRNCELIMGALAGALREFQRCVVDPYEQKKTEQNGAVYCSDVLHYPPAGKY